MKNIKEFMINEASIDNYTNIINSVKEEFKALASRSNDKEYEYETYDFIYEILKCFDISNTYNIDKNIIEEIKNLRYKIREQYL